MSFTFATAMIFAALSASLVRDSDANQNGLGAWKKARDRRYTIEDHRYPLVVRVVLDVTAGKVAKVRSTQRTGTLPFGE